MLQKHDIAPKTDENLKLVAEMAKIKYKKPGLAEGLTAVPGFVR